eukprot:gnl/Spiro4/29624_TR14528_c0_g1_i1.p1 gnl/Spiro4/29624_TR14528_c0_g1~~gnl/Spiro4/29624_TR14528_c0_g1_i1.p1  ORF type:complete len:702 (-),score=124.17 gnl/Spiro4/29624_TR14528_c0_g1_i1:56-2161(-)
MASVSDGGGLPSQAQQLDGPGLNTEQVAELQELFEEYCSPNGLLSAPAFKEILIELGCETSIAQTLADDVIEKMGCEEERALTFPLFLQAVNRGLCDNIALNPTLENFFTQMVKDSNLTPEQIAEVSEVFSMHANLQARVPLAKLPQILAELLGKKNVTDELVLEFTNDMVVAHDSGMMELTPFVHVFGSHIRFAQMLAARMEENVNDFGRRQGAVLGARDLADLREAFLSADASGSGAISRSQLAVVLRAIGGPDTAKDLLDLMGKLGNDQDPNAPITYEEFIHTMAIHPTMVHTFLRGKKILHVANKALLFLDWTHINAVTAELARLGDFMPTLANLRLTGDLPQVLACMKLREEAIARAQDIGHTLASLLAETAENVHSTHQMVVAGVQKVMTEVIRLEQARKAAEKTMARSRKRNRGLVVHTVRSMHNMLESAYQQLQIESELRAKVAALVGRKAALQESKRAAENDLSRMESEAARLGAELIKSRLVRKRNVGPSAPAGVDIKELLGEKEQLLEENFELCEKIKTLLEANAMLLEQEEECYVMLANARITMQRMRQMLCEKRSYAAAAGSTSHEHHRSLSDELSKQIDSATLSTRNNSSNGICSNPSPSPPPPPPPAAPSLKDARQQAANQTAHKALVLLCETRKTTIEGLEKRLKARSEALEQCQLDKSKLFELLQAERRKNGSSSPLDPAQFGL